MRISPVMSSSSSKPEVAPPSAIYVVDDDPAVRTALSSLFRSVDYEVHTYGSADEFAASGSATGAGCLVLDIRLPRVSGLDFQSQLADLGVTMPVVLMTGHGDIPMTVRGMKAGAIDFLPKPFREQDMLDAVALALARDIETRAERGQTDNLRVLYETLTQREREVVPRVAAGLMNKQIAFELGLSEITIKIHRSKAMRKLGAKTLADFVKMAELLKL